MHFLARMSRDHAGSTGPQRRWPLGLCRKRRKQEDRGCFKQLPSTSASAVVPGPRAHPPANESRARIPNTNHTNTHQSKLLPCESALAATVAGPARKKKKAANRHPLEATAFHVNINHHGPNPTYQESHAGNTLLSEPVCFLGHCHPSPRRRRLRPPA